MTTISPRTQSLLNRLPKNHPLSASMRDAMIAAAAASEGLSDYKSTKLAQDPKLTPRGKSDALTEALTTTHGKAWIRANASVVKERKAIDADRRSLVIKPIDPTNVVAALLDQEIRSWVRTLDLGVRESLVLSARDRRIVEAVVSAPPELSGFAGDAATASKIEERYIELTYPDKLAAIEAKNAVVSEAEASMHIQYNELRSTVDIDMHPRDFDALMKSIEPDRPLLVDDGKQVLMFGPDGKASYRLATETDRTNGIPYKDSSEYKAAQAA